MQMVSKLRMAALAVLLSAGAGLAQTAPAGECSDAAGVAEAATQPDPSADGAAAANSGSTAWTGATGGSQIGTNPQGAVPESRTWQPATARGLDLKGVPEAVAAAPGC
ncbi:MAG: hypothetical protein Q4G24_12595 [Paracoccus sp. (in: a-proteobacteria)]|uniref:hypothetical protein n=1 Tax=Paracoccus sp. TaxID=267 RepID=UPI0026E089DB|nr:hypothetical protein [Paracoccus sp. (in: a-proteobacteria)]MDO5622297.1 hypothetical protein [Paracoccus sp. (in: a-proteobacteria)]